MPMWSGWPAKAAPRSLSRNGTPRKGPSGRSPAAASRALVEERVDDRVELGVERLDAGDRGLDELGGARLARAHELGLVRRVHARESRRPSACRLLTRQ